MPKHGMQQKTVLRGKLIAINTNIKKEEGSQKPNFTPQEIRKRRTRIKIKVSRRKEIIIIRLETV